MELYKVLKALTDNGEYVEIDGTIYESFRLSKKLKNESPDLYNGEVWSIRKVDRYIEKHDSIYEMYSLSVFENQVS